LYFVFSNDAMKNVYLLIAILSTSLKISAQCTGCVVDPTCTASPASPALCPSVLANAVQNEPYDVDVTFFMPNEFDNGGINVTLSTIQITSVSGLPGGILWTASETDNIYDISSDPATQRGCVKFCGTPSAIGSYTIAVNVLATVTSPITTTVAQSFTVPLLVTPGGGGNSGFSFSPSSGCDSIAVDFEALISSSTQPVVYSWNFGNGNTSTVALPETQFYTQPDTYLVSLQTDLLDYVLESVTFNATGTNWCGDIEEPSIPFVGTCTGSPDIYFIYTVGSATLQSSTIDNNTGFNQSNLGYIINQPSFSLAFFDEDLITQPDNLGSTVIQVNGPGTFTFNTNEGFGTYTIGTTVGLSFTNTDTVIVYDSPEVPVISASDSVVCTGDTIYLSATNAPFYQWFADTSIVFGANDSVFTVLNSGTYAVEVRSEAGCTAKSADVNLIVAQVPDAPTVFFNPVTEDLLCNPGTGLSWYWLIDGVEIPFSQDMPSISPSEIGNYSVFSISEFGCSVFSNEYYYTNVGINDLQSHKNLRIYPNPLTGNTLNISGIEESLNLAIQDASGRVVHQQFLPAETIKQIQLPELAPGIYFLRMTGKSGSRSSKLLIAEK
jgi:hypothetical protein